jgi:hypothetical protein
VVSDRVTGDLPEGCHYNNNEIYWRYIPDSIVYKYMSPDITARVKALKKEGKATSSLRYPYDLRFNFKRWIFVTVHEHNHHKKFKRYYKVEEK